MRRRVSDDRMKRHAADELTVAVEHHDFEGALGAAAALSPPSATHTAPPRRRAAGRASFAISSTSSAVFAPRASSTADGRPPASAKRSASQARSTAPERECRSSNPCASFVILAMPPAMVTLRHRVAAQIFQHAAGEIAHVDQGLSRAGRRAPARAFSEVEPVAPATWVEAAGAGDIDAAMDRVDPGRAGIGNDHARGAEDRQPADDAEPRIERLLRNRLAARNGDLDLDIRRVPPTLRAASSMAVADHLARHRIDGRLARRQGQARRG